MRITAFSVLALGFGVVGGTLLACGTSGDDCAATATCAPTGGSSSAGSGHSGSAGSGASGGDAMSGASAGGSQNTSGTSGSSGTMGGGGEGGGGATGCSGDVSDDAACWTTDELGVFVSSQTGDDTNGDGTQAKPYETITKGITNAAGKNVYVCAGATEYSEQILLDGTTDGLRIYGGFSCDDWSYKKDRNSSVLSPEPIALRIQSLKKGVYIENLWFQAKDGNDTSIAAASSYGAFVTNSTGVVLNRVKLMAGKGAKGKDQEAAGPGMNGSEAGTAPKGSDGICTVPPKVPAGGSWGAIQFCSLGGTGGTGLKNTANGDDGAPGSPTEKVHPLSGIENGGPGATMTDGVGENGGDGMTGDSGGPGEAAGAGTFAVNGFVPAAGKAGTDGHPGQGGGGGGASKGTSGCYGASGGAGGMGGCGGHPGQGGGGGGASVGLLAIGSAISLSDCVITSAAGGAGGKGGDGGDGGAGAAGGAVGGPVPGSVARGGAGGFGGNGGPGGSGSGGSGGPSYALAYSGTKPTYGAETMLIAAGGGAEGAGGKGAPAGTKGASELELEIK